MAGTGPSRRAAVAATRADLESEPDRAADLASRLAADGIGAETTADLDAATREADIITTCTRSHQPLIKGRNLRPGTHLDLVGGYTPQTRAADDEAAKLSRVFVDRRESAF